MKLTFFIQLSTRNQKKLIYQNVKLSNSRHIVLLTTSQEVQHPDYESSAHLREQTF